MPRDLVENLKEPFTNWRGEVIETTHLEITYYVPSDDNKRITVLPIDAVNEFANRNGINGPYVSGRIDKKEAIERGLL